MHTRQALSQDVPRIAEIHTTSWQTAFRGIMPDEFLDQQNVQEIAARWLKNIREYPGNLWIVENEEHTITGFVCNGRRINKTNFPTYEGEIFGIHVDPVAKRQGYGHQLMEASFLRLESLGCRNIMLWTLEENSIARNFYEKLGGRVIGKESKNFGGKNLVELAYGWESTRLAANLPAQHDER